jgi:NADPH:quinone reductase-like Zn-dependent oxidoreductase
MKAIICTRFGPPEVLQLQEVAKPVPKDNEVLIKVHATSVTAGDCNIRGFVFIPPGLGPLARLMLGFRKPKRPILGADFAGEIEEAGKGVNTYKAGDRVFGIDGNNSGAYAEYMCVRADGAIAPIPANISYEQAASVCFGGLTALYFLREKGKIQSGQKVLVRGASGSVGSAAVQLAAYFGAEVTGVCSTANIALVKALGAHKVIDYTREEITGNGATYDLILDPVVGKTTFSLFKKSLKPGGMYLAVAGGLKEMVQSLTTSLVGNKKVIFGGGTACESKENVAFLAELLEAGKYQPVIDRCYPLEEIVEAHRYADKGHKKGNVVITVGP